MLTISAYHIAFFFGRCCEDLLVLHAYGIPLSRSVLYFFFSSANSSTRDRHQIRLIYETINRDETHDFVICWYVVWVYQKYIYRPLVKKILASRERTDVCSSNYACIDLSSFMFIQILLLVLHCILVLYNIKSKYRQN